MSEVKDTPWTCETVQVREDGSAYAVVKDAKGRVLFDTLNSDVAEIHTEHGEDGATRWDETGRVNLTLAASAPGLLAFKRYVHGRLDAAGVTVDPDSPHKAAGCRIGGRLDELIGERDALRGQCDRFRGAAAALLATLESVLPELESIGPLTEIDAAHATIARAKAALSA